MFIRVSELMFACIECIVQGKTTNSCTLLSDCQTSIMSFFQLISPLLYSPPLGMLLQTLVNIYLSESYCVTLVMEQPIDFNVNKSFTYLTPSNISVNDLMNQLLETSEMGCSDYIVHMSDPQRFISAFDLTSRFGNIRRSNRKIVILPYSSEPDYVNQSLELLTMKESTFVANLLVILHRKQANTDCDVYDLVTHEFINIYHDRPLYLDQWNSCSQKFAKNVHLFPHNLEDLNGRIVRVACFTYKPYSLLELDTAVVPSQRDGIEVRIVDEFCTWVNCTIEIIGEEDDQWGEIFGNGTGIGIIGDVVMDEADMGISALYSWYEEYLYLDFSAAAIRSAVTCVAPSPRRLASWQMPLLPFSLYTWCGVFLSFVLSSIGLTVAYRSSTQNIFLRVFGMIIAQSQPDDLGSWRVRRITGWLLVASLVIVSAYGAGLASTFTVPKYEASIDTVQDLVGRNMEWGATHDAWIFSLALSNEPLIKQLVSKFRIYSGEELQRKSFTGNMAFSIEKLPAGYFAIGDYITKKALLDLTLMLEDFYYEQCVVMMRKSSVYTEKMSEHIGRLHQSGLLLAWETQVALKYLNFEVQQEVKLSRTKTDTGLTKALSLRDAIGIFIIYFIGVIIATIIFIGEWITARTVRKTKQIK